MRDKLTEYHCVMSELENVENALKDLSDCMLLVTSHIEQNGADGSTAGTLNVLLDALHHARVKLNKAVSWAEQLRPSCTHASTAED